MLSIAKARTYLKDMEPLNDSEVKELLQQLYTVAEISVSLYSSSAIEAENTKLPEAFPEQRRTYAQTN